MSANLQVGDHITVQAKPDGVQLSIHERYSFASRLLTADEIEALVKALLLSAVRTRCFKDILEQTS